MHHIHTTATAVEKLKRSAKARRDSHNCLLAEALDAVAVQAGYTGWKHVTQCAAVTRVGAVQLLPPRHRHLLTWVVLAGEARPIPVESVEQLCEVLGGIRPYFIREQCSYAPPGGHCLCELDPFATAIQANIHLDIGDKHDFWNWMFDKTQSARTYSDWHMRLHLGLATDANYPNEHLTTRGNRDRSNALNPNNPAHQSALDNRSMQLNPENWRYGIESGQ